MRSESITHESFFFRESHHDQRIYTFTYINIFIIYLGSELGVPVETQRNTFTLVTHLLEFFLVHPEGEPCADFRLNDFESVGIFRLFETINEYKGCREKLKFLTNSYKSFIQMRTSEINRLSVSLSINPK